MSKTKNIQDSRGAKRSPQNRESIEGAVLQLSLKNGAIPYIITADNEWYFHIDSLLHVLQIPYSNHVVIFTNLKRKGFSKLFQFGIGKTYVFAKAIHILSCYGLKAAAKRAGFIQFLDQNKINYR